MRSAMTATARWPCGPQARLVSPDIASTAPAIARSPITRCMLARPRLPAPRQAVMLASNALMAQEGTMRGVVFTGERQLELMNFADPTPGEGEVVLEMKASGMCGSDLHQYRRPKNVPRTATGIPASADPVIAGHEPC